MSIEEYVKLVEDTLQAQQDYFNCPKSQPAVKQNLLQRSKELETKLRDANKKFRAKNASKLQEKLF